MKFIIGKKIEMTQIFDGEGNVIPVTKILAGPCFVSQVKTEEKDGYNAVQLAFGKKKKIKKSLAGHLKEIGNYTTLKEFRAKDTPSLKRGEEIKAAIFEEGEIVNVTGFSKGKGFQGVVKRHGFKGFRATHGNKDQLRMPGSIGATGPAKVFKGTRMGGRMGHEQVTAVNLEIIKINQDKNEIFIEGAVPGPRNEILKIVTTGKKVERKKEESKSDKKSAQGATPKDGQGSASGGKNKDEVKEENKKA